jgi:hypothetical protein
MKPKETKPVKTGRPSKYSESTADLICALIAEGKSLRQICTLDALPSEATVYVWLNTYAVFQENYARAREVQAERFFEEIREIAFDDSRDASGELAMPNPTAVNRDRLKVDSLKWMLGKMLPKKYGDKVEMEHSGGVTLVHSIPRPIR